MKTSNQLHNSKESGYQGDDRQGVFRDDKPGRPQVTGENDSRHRVGGKRETPATIGNVHLALPMWQEIAILGLAVLLIAYSYYTTN